MKNIFVEKKADKRALSLRGLIHGVGINDADYIIGYKINGKITLCPYYKAWKNMMVRCYSDEIMRIADLQENIDVKNGLHRHANFLMGEVKYVA